VTSGIIVFAHGSRIESANQAVRAVAAELARAGGFEHVEPAFLELGQPDLAEAVARLSGQGVRRILVIPYFLTLGIHLERDLPAIVREISKSNNDLEIAVTPPLDGHPGLVQVLLERARAGGA
jgi:sirohydrochlorin ferrochelatase